MKSKSFYQYIHYLIADETIFTCKSTIFFYTDFFIHILLKNRNRNINSQLKNYLSVLKYSARLLILSIIHFKLIGLPLYN